MKIRLLLLASIAAFSLGGCNKNDDAMPGGTPGEPVAPAIPAGFGWSAMARVNLTLESAVATYVSVYSDAACSDEGMLARNIPLEAGEPGLFPLTLPVDAETLYVKYPAASGEMAVVPVAVQPSSDADPVDVNYRFPNDAVATSFQMNDGYSYWRNRGVIMVEDRWPDFAASDADFNDLVVEYDMELTECNVPAMLPAHGYKEGVVVTLDIRGVGSGRTQKAGLQLLNLDHSVIGNVETAVYEKSGQGVFKKITDDRFKIEVDKSQPGKAIILFDGLDKLVDGKHYQTTQGEIITGKPMIRAYIKFSGVADRSKLTGEESRRQAIALREVPFDTYSHDFFMVLKPAYGSAEIHQKGYAPTYRYTGYEADAQGKMSDVPYCSQNNEVWMLRLPVGTRHAYDRVSIFTAYPQLAGWIEANGQKNRVWYRTFEDKLVAPWW